MSTKENVLFSLRDDITPKVAEGDSSFTLSTNGERACVVTYKKTSHAKSKDDGQGWAETEINDTLNAFDNGESRTPTLIRQTVFYNHSQDAEYHEMGDKCQTIAATFGMGGNNQPFVVEESCDMTIGFNRERCGAVTMEDKMPTIQAAAGESGNNQPMVCEKNIEAVVRRLTPLECERLQGFPDGWTDIGEWIDSKGKTHKDADSPRYKALGNSIALPFWEWMAERMCKQYPEGYQVEMASLFDGIGGFPLVFSRCGAKPVWASEIEEFPIAVTKIRFPEDKENGDGNTD